MSADRFFSTPVLNCRWLNLVQTGSYFVVEGNILGKGCCKLYQNVMVTRSTFSSRSVLSAALEMEKSEPKFCVLLGNGL